MTLAYLLNEIEKRFAAAWGSTTPIAWSNVKFDPLKSREWVRLTVLPASSNVASLGTETGWLEQSTGVIDIAIFTDVGKGNKRAFELASQAKQIFDRQAFAGNAITCFAGSVQNIGAQGGDFYQVSVTIPFLYQENRSS